MLLTAPGSTAAFAPDVPWPDGASASLSALSMLRRPLLPILLFRRALPTLVVLVMLASSSGAAGAEPAPWRIDDLLPERISLSFQTRVRYEYLFNQFRAGTTGDADILVLRTLLHGRVRATDRLTFGAEMLDARAYFQQIPVSTGIVNSFELLQGYAEFRAG